MEAVLERPSRARRAASASDAASDAVPAALLVPAMRSADEGAGIDEGAIRADACGKSAKHVETRPSLAANDGLKPNQGVVGDAAAENEHELTPTERWALRAIGLDGTRSLKNDAQINVRMSSELKRAGDEALAAAGLTSSEAVRMLYAFAAAHASEPDAVRRVLSGETSKDQAVQKLERERKVAAFHEAMARIDAMMAEAGLCRSCPETDNLSYKELEDLFYEDELEAGGWL